MQQLLPAPEQQYSTAFWRGYSSTLVHTLRLHWPHKQGIWHWFSYHAHDTDIWEPFKFKRNTEKSLLSLVESITEKNKGWYNAIMQYIPIFTSSQRRISHLYFISADTILSCLHLSSTWLVESLSPWPSFGLDYHNTHASTRILLTTFWTCSPFFTYQSNFHVYLRINLKKKEGKKERKGKSME